MGQWGACYGEHEILCIPHRYSSAWLAGVRCERSWPFSLNIHRIRRGGEGILVKLRKRSPLEMETANRYARDRTTRQRAVVVNSIMKWEYHGKLRFFHAPCLSRFIAWSRMKTNFGPRWRRNRCRCKQVSWNDTFFHGFWCLVVSITDIASEKKFCIEIRRNTAQRGKDLFQ